MKNQGKIAVALAKRPEYVATDVSETVRALLETIKFFPTRGMKVLVKPNLLTPRPPDHITCTHPLVVRAVCEYLLDAGCEVRVGDSPTFGKAVDMAESIGLTRTLADLPVTLVNLDKPKLVRFSFGGTVPMSRVALENDLIVSVPKLKAHHQMRITGAVKNVYGCVTGLGKPVLHLLHGDRGCRWESMILEIREHLPPSVSLMDAVKAMHVHGPVKGQSYSMGLLAASNSAVALDTAVMNMLGLKPEDAPLWRLSVNLNLPGATPEEIVYPLETPESFNGKDFRFTRDLYPISFRPLKVAAHYLRRLRAT
jgi:uncharacterized protein (DUF362 family)